MSWFDSVVDTTSGAFNWLKKNGEVASAIAGAAGSALNYINQKEDRSWREKMFDKQWAQRNKRTYFASNPQNYRYDSHSANLTGGLLTQGLVANTNGNKRS
ncbi:hypothetical protein KCM76_22945 [Zooshikella marina]|uniref:hypothetical protein n=1 Tax=Zooshikella ganghwensis TaxID=202772 RepID=UPI001BAF3A66|nr:hypothetical protein [Zooshikella ganghwensis]MBU2708870.1 hypothetical protein [Zooshikella ganghwensis]